jgi:hypothetical protein
MKPRINLFLTFDYELPLGGWTVPPQEALISPAERLLHLCDELRVPVTFFVDTLCGIQFRRWGETAFEDDMRRQLRLSAEKGHDLQLHLHPHWIASAYYHGSYLPSRKFRLADFTPEWVEERVEESIEYLEGIARPADSAYRCLAFRAGGFNLDRQATIFESLRRNRIRIDSSLCDGFYFASDSSVVDFRNLPDLPNWYFPDDDFRKTAATGIYEIPIAGKPKAVFELPSFVKMKMHRDRKPQTRGQMIHGVNQLSFGEKWRSAMSARMLSFDNYAFSVKNLLDILQYNIKRFAGFEEINLSAIGHPKSMDTYNFRLMKGFVESVRERYGEQVHFMTFRTFTDRT